MFRTHELQLHVPCRGVFVMGCDVMMMMVQYEMHPVVWSLFWFSREMIYVLKLSPIISNLKSVQNTKAWSDLGGTAISFHLLSDI